VKLVYVVKWMVRTEAVIHTDVFTLRLLVPVKEARLENGSYVLEQNVGAFGK